MKAKPNQVEVLQELEQVATRVGRSDYAARINTRLIKLMPNNPIPHGNLGLALQQQGAFKDAEAVYRKAIKKWPTHAALYRMWFLGHKFKSASDPAITSALKLWRDKTLDDANRENLGFALAKAMADIGRHDKVFDFLRPANEIGKRQYPFDRSIQRGLNESFREAATEPRIAREGTSEFAPIFVLGTPRSGTTLVERIIAAHPDVSAGGEIAQAFFLHGVLLRPKDQPTPIADLAPELMASFARQYEITAREVSQTKGPLVTDKSLLNNMIVGWLAAAFPRARFIAVKRNPPDVALSIYRNYFTTGTHIYSHDLGDIASVIRNYENDIAHWRDRVDLTEIDYDLLTADPEGESRKLIAAAGLDWDDACLEFYKQKSNVRTLSLAQVREPIYKKSSGGWKTYEKDMQPFWEAWEQDA